MLPLFPLFCIPVRQYFMVPVLVLPSISIWVAIPGDRSAAAASDKCSERSSIRAVYAVERRNTVKIVCSPNVIERRDSLVIAEQLTP
jgi:hypothetical protein